MPPVMPHIQAGKLRGLAISTPKRLAQLPEVPTFVEEGITGFDVANWYGVMAPAGTSREIIAKLNTDINKAMQVPEVRTRLEGVGTQLKEQSAAEFEAYMKSEVAKYAKLIKDTGVKIE
jgi:tripartite-type tricarboxylate transporter receptor subunit TctC